MKKLLIILCLILSVNCAYGGQFTATIDKLENEIFGFQYGNETDEMRLKRIEENVYGQSSNKSTSERIAKLTKDLSANEIGKEIAPREDTFMDETGDYIDEQPVAQGPNVDYPAVNELERQVFNKENKNMDIKERLSYLEKQTFGKTYNDDLSTRVDRLRAEIKPSSLMDNEIAQSSNEFYDDEIVELDKDYHLDRYEPPAFDYDAYNARHSSPSQSYKPRKTNLASIEKSLFKQSYTNDDMNNRLSRIESGMFGTTFANDNQQDRINRISSAYSAQKTARTYDSNKFTQNMATAMQIGTLILMVLACVL